MPFRKRILLEMAFLFSHMLAHQDSFEIGYITKTRGLKGELQVFFQYDEPEQLELDVVFIELHDRLVPFFVNSYQLLANKTGYFFFEDVNHIDQAKDLLKMRVFLPNTKLPERNPGEFLVTDLKGFMVQEKTHGQLGVIIEINEFPQQFIATVTYQGINIMFPLNDDFIMEIDQEEKIVKMMLPDGLLDVYLK